MRAEFYELQEGIDGRFRVIVIVIEFLEKQHLSSGREQEFVSVQSFKKQKEGSSTGLCTDRAVRRVRLLVNTGQFARTVSVL